MNPRSKLGSKETALHPFVPPHIPMQSWNVGAKDWLKSLPLMMELQKVSKLTLLFLCDPDSFGQSDDAFATSPMAASESSLAPVSPFLTFALRLHVVPL